MAIPRYFTFALLLGACIVGPAYAQNRKQAPAGKNQPSPPKVDAEAPNFTLKTAEGTSIELKELTSKQPVVLVVLRGWPGYQCPLCGRQVGEFLVKKEEIEKLGAKVLLVYPGPQEKLGEYAKEFLKGYKLSLPENFIYVTDPDYTFTNAWGLRWEAERETSYPSTFVIGKDNKIKFAMTSTTHGGRTPIAKVLEALTALK